MDIFTQLVLTVGRIAPDHVVLLGTGFIVSADGKVVTTHHVTGGDDRGLVVLAPHIRCLSDYQDVADNRCSTAAAKISEIDPIRDICVLKCDLTYSGSGPPELGSFDNDKVGDDLWIFGYPHCTEGRRVLTFQHAELGAKVLHSNNDVKSKHGVMNVQARPGQSGSPVFSPKSNKVSGILLGAWVPGQGILLGNINPYELHQTTQCVSAEYVRDML